MVALPCTVRVVDADEMFVIDAVPLSTDQLTKWKYAAVLAVAVMVILSP